MTIKGMESVEKSKVAAGENTWIQVLLASDETPHFAMRRFTIEPGGFMPYHTNTVEHEQLMQSAQTPEGGPRRIIAAFEVAFPARCRALGEQ